MWKERPAVELKFHPSCLSKMSWKARPCLYCDSPTERRKETDLEQPCSIPDFLDYLIYVAHDAENLQFFLWLRDYTKRFNNLAPAQKRLSPKWLADEAPPDLTSTKKSYIHVGQLLKSNADNMDSFNYYRNGKSNVPYANLTKSEQERCMNSTTTP